MSVANLQVGGRKLDVGGVIFKAKRPQNEFTSVPIAQSGACPEAQRADLIAQSEFTSEPIAPITYSSIVFDASGVRCCVSVMPMSKLIVATLNLQPTRP